MTSILLIRIAASLALPFIVVACGGGGDYAPPPSVTTTNPSSATTPGTPTSSLPKYTIAGIINGASGPLSDANVAFDLAGVVVQTNTSPDGSYTLAVPNNSNTYPNYIAGIVKKAGYVNSTVRVSTKDGDFRVVSTDVLAVSTEADLAILNDGSRIVHLGDNFFSGSANSQLQVAGAKGLSQKYFFTSITDSMAAQYTETCISFDGRGIQSTIARDTIVLGPITKFLIDSPVDGSFQTAKYCFKTVPSGANNFFTINSGNDNNRISDYDDFEIINPVVTLAGKVS